jgi:hypothetical protein
VAMCWLSKVKWRFAIMLQWFLLASQPACDSHELREGRTDFPSGAQVFQLN